VDYIDWSKAKRAVFPNLRPSTETISLRLPAPLLADLKTLANERDVPYQSLLKVYLAEQVRQQQAAAGRHNPQLQPPGRTHGGEREAAGRPRRGGRAKKMPRA
jgi:hypothetical protein